MKNICKFARLEIMFVYSLQVVLSQIEHVGIVDPYSSVEMSAENAVVHRVSCRRNLLVSVSVQNVVFERLGNVATDTAHIASAERREHRHAAT